MEEAICPFCNRVIRSDANAPESCAMCGMGVYHPDAAPRIDMDGDGVLYFCCSWCLRLYSREVKHTRPRMMDDQERDGVDYQT